LRGDVVLGIPYLKLVEEYFGLLPWHQLKVKEECFRNLIFGGHFMRMIYRLHPVSSNTNFWLCSTCSALAYVLMSNVIE